MFSWLSRWLWDIVLIFHCPHWRIGIPLRGKALCLDCWEQVPVLQGGPEIKPMRWSKKRKRQEPDVVRELERTRKK